MAETEPVKMKSRPIMRIGTFFISHSVLVSVVCLSAGVLNLLLLPILAKNTYFSENALMPGSANPMLSSQDVSEANSFVKQLTDLNFKPSSTGIEIPRMIAQHMADIGAEVSYHKVHPQLNKFHPLHFFSSPHHGIIHENYSCSLHGINTVGIIRAPRGDGKESIVLVTPYDSLNTTLGEALSLGIAYSVFSLLTRVTWLAKDIIWLAADSRHGEYASVAAWLRDYHTPLFNSMERLDYEMCDERNTLFEPKTRSKWGTEISGVSRRAGTMSAALVIKVAERNEEMEKDTLSIYAEASNGQMPNLDLINVVNYLAVHGQGLQVKVKKVASLSDSLWLKLLGEIFESLGKFARSLNPKSKFGIPAADYIEGASTLASSLYHQALGVPTGPHGAFRDYQIDSITLEISPKVSLNNKIRRNEFLQRGGRLVEGVIRSVNNLLEKFHQSFFLYLLTSPGKFVSVGVYMIAFTWLIASLPAVAASLYSYGNRWSSISEDDKPTSFPASVDKLDITFRSWKWLQAAKTVLVVHLWGVIVALLPYFISQIPNRTPATSILIWVLLSGFTLLILHLALGSPFSHNHVSQSQKRDWALLKSVMIPAAFIGLSLMSVINFATAEIGALLVIPMCLMVSPFRLEAKAQTLRAFGRAACNMVLLYIGFPPAAYTMLKGAFEGFSSIDIGGFWNWVESLWAWNSATYLYICMIHLPLWVLCVYTSLHPC